MSINKVILVGNVGKDPVIRYFDKGVAKVTFPLATSETYTSQQGETITSTEWHNIVLWRGLAEVAESYLKKGNSIFIEGKIRTRDWTDKDGNKRYTTEIVADNMVMLGGRREQSDGSYSPPSKQEKPASQEPPEQITDLTAETGGDDLPF